MTTKQRIGRLERVRAESVQKLLDQYVEHVKATIPDDVQLKIKEDATKGIISEEMKFCFLKWIETISVSDKALLKSMPSDERLSVK